jgi:hypothetical protein
VEYPNNSIGESILSSLNLYLIYLPDTFRGIFVRLVVVPAQVDVPQMAVPHKSPSAPIVTSVEVIVFE